MSKRPVKKHLFHVLILSLVIMLAGGGIALLYQWHLGNTSSYASSDYVVGSPSLPASYVDRIFRQMGSPMVGTGQAVEAASRARNIDDAFALAVWWTETNDGAAGVGLADRNPGSVRGSVGYPSAFDGYTIYPSYTAAVNYWFMMMQKVYINRGLTTVSAISHPYVGTSTSDLWAGKVITLMQRYRAEAPPPPTPAPTVAPDMVRQGKQLSQEQQQQGQGKSTYYPPVASTASSGQAQTQTASASSGLSSKTRLALVLFDLLLALAIGMWAWTVKRRYSAPTSASIAPGFAEQLAANGQQPAALAAQTAPWLQQQAAMQPVSNPWELQQASPRLPISNPWELQQAAMAQAANSLWGQTPIAGQQSVFQFQAFEDSQRTTEELSPDMRTTEMLAAVPAPSARPNYTASASLFSLEAFMAEQEPFPGSPTGQPEVEEHTVEQQDWPFNITTYEQSTFAASYERTTSDDGQSTPAAGFERTVPFMPGRGLFGLSRAGQGVVHYSDSQSESAQPQPVGTGSGGGLLSRYREKQTQSEQA
jgi:hypothetical protein